MKLIFLSLFLFSALSANTLSRNLLKEYGCNKNILISSYSLQEALRLAAIGASGQTKEEIEALFAEEKKEVACLQSASIVCVDEAFFPYDSYLQEVENLGAKAVSANLLASIDTINEWVKEKTNGKITDLVEKGDLKESTKLLLLNAIYLKSAWKKPFKKEKTTKSPFYPKDMAAKDVFMMHAVEPVMYWETNGAQMVSKALRDDAEVIIAISDDIPDLDLFDNFKTKKLVDLSLPKFSLSSSLDLSTTLQAIGIKEAFTNRADFSRISSEKLQIEKVKQKTTLNLAEEGLEASAATSISIGLTSIQIDPVPDVTFRCDRPFYLFIRDTKTNTVVFEAYVGTIY